MFSRKVLALSCWFFLLFYVLLNTLSQERFYTAGLDQKPVLFFHADKLERVAYHFSNHFDMEADAVETTQKKEVSYKVKGHLDYLDFSADLMTFDPKNGLFLEGNVSIRDLKEKKTIHSEKAFIDYKKGYLELSENPIIFQEDNQQNWIKAKKICYQKTGLSYSATIEGPIECIVEDLNLKDYDPFNREKAL